MEIGLGLDGSLELSFDELRDLGAEATRRGFESLWTTAGGVPDPFHVCVAWARASAEVAGTSVRTGIGVLPAPRIWQPLPLAAQASTVGLVSGGAFVLGIGSGGGANADHFATLGLANRPIAAMRSYLKALRTLLSGDEIGADVDEMRVVPGRLSGEVVDVPLYLGALGPQMLRLAGASADGVSLSWAVPHQIAWSEERLREGVALSGRDRSSVVLSGYVRVCVDDDVDLARRCLVAQFLRYGLRATSGPSPLNVYRAHFARMGFEEALADLEQQRARGAGPDELADHFPEELVELIGYYGDGSDAPARYAQLSAGLDETVVRVIGVRSGRETVERVLDALAPEKIREYQ